MLSTKKFYSDVLKALVFSVTISLVESHGTLHIQFDYYSSGGRTAGGVSCDSPHISKAGIGINDLCDPKFQVCVWRIFSGGQQNESGRQLFAYLQSGSYRNQDYINFVEKLGDEQNPLEIEVDYDDNQGYVWFEVRVLDQDGDEPGEIMSEFSSKLEASGEHIRPVDLKSKTNQILSLRYWFSCSPNYYTPLCNKHCAASNDDQNGHIWCNQDGDKMCRYGWVNVSSNCTQKHPCRTCLCRNGGVCIAQGGEGYRCQCPSGFDGSHCENCRDGGSKCENNSTISGNTDCDIFTATGHKRISSVVYGNEESRTKLHQYGTHLISFLSGGAAGGIFVFLLCRKFRKREPESAQMSNLINRGDHQNVLVDLNAS